MTYLEFIEYIMVHLWKQGDQIVYDNLPTIIKTAEAELNRKLKVEDRIVTAEFTLTDGVATIPTDCRSIRQVISPTVGGMTYLAPADYADRKACGSLTPKFYTSANNKILAHGSKDAKLEVWYYSYWFNFGSVDYSNPDVIPIYGPLADYLDIYLYCVLKHTAPFLREDDRLSTWAALYEEGMLAAQEENDHERKYVGSPLKIKMPAGIR
jgi:hypothetical protein